MGSKTLNCLLCTKEFKAYDSQIKKGGGKYCSISCSRTHKNLIDNPAKREEVRKKISENHADVSGEKNPMYGRKNEKAPSYKHGLTSLAKQRKIKHMESYRILATLNLLEVCFLCGKTENLDVHHKDGNHDNNDLKNLVWLCRKCHNTKAHTHIRDEYGRFTGIILTNQID